ncbi:MAG: LysR family transcriptional regulator, partial [bacterium]|nr:LysR family transcriptional regulator [bacterium]
MDLLDVRQLLAFKTIVETGGFTKAARQLNLTQSALSHQIKTLETQLQTQVFNRVGKRVVMTQAGEVLLRYAAPVLQQLLEARRTIDELQKPGHGRLRTSAATYTCYQVLPHVLREFRVTYPHVELFVAAEYTNVAVQGLLSGELDLGIFVLPPSTNGLHVEDLCQDELVVIVAPSHPWAHRRRVQWSDLATQVLITYNRASETFQKIQHELQDRGITLQETMEVQHGAAVMEMVKVGLGVALVPSWVVREDISAGVLVGLSLGRSGMKRQWVIAHAKEAPLPSYSQEFMKICHKWFPHLMNE